MADELEPPVEGEATPAPEIQEEGQEEQQQVTVESLASDLGWKPQDQWKGDGWLPADEFLRKGRESRSELNRELRSLRDEVGRISRTSAELTERLVTDKVAERDAYWKRIHAQAIEKDDPELAERAVQERIKLATEAPRAPEPGMPSETQAFVEKHSAWFGKDRLATLRARQICDELAKDGVPIPEQLKEAERAVKREFPELFPAPNKAPAATQTAGSRTATPSAGRKKGYMDMPAESRAMADDYEKRLGIPKDKFAESYWSQNERKVG